MKVFISAFALVVCISAEWTPKTNEELKDLRDICIKESSLTDDYIKQMQNSAFPDAEPVRKYILCTVVKMGIFTAENGYDAVRVSQQVKIFMNKSDILKIATGCIEKNPKCDCQSADMWAYNGFKCFLSNKVGEHINAILAKIKAATAAGAKPK